NVPKPEPNNESVIEKANTKIDFLALVDDLLPIAPKIKKHLALQGIGCSAETFCHPDTIGSRSFLKFLARLPRLNVGDCNRSDAWMTEASQHLFDDIGGREFGIVIDREDDFTRA